MTRSSSDAPPVRARLTNRWSRGGTPVIRHAPAEPRSLTDARARVAPRMLAGARRPRHEPLIGLPGLLLLTDLLALLVSAVVVDVPVGIHAAFAVVVLVSRACMRLYRSRLHLSVLDEVPRTAGASTAAAGVLLVLLAVAPTQPATPREVLGLVSLFTVLALVQHTVLLAAVRAVRRRRGARERTLVLGAGRVGCSLAQTLLDHPDLGLLPVGFVDADALTGPDELPLPVVSTELGRLSETLQATRATTVVIAFSGAREASIVDTVITAHQSGCSVLVVPRMFELHHDGPDVERIRGIPLIRLRPDPTLRPTWWVKRLLDVVFGSLGLLITSPVLLLTALAVLLENGRPVLFWQERVGLDHRLFRLCKFRSLPTVNERESQTRWSVSSDDPRVGPVGRLLRRSSLDELPQLWNIARGDMSLVGPRPERLTFVERFSDEHERYWARHRVPVGLTGLAQVNGLRGDTSIRERARYDNYYIANWSLWLDAKILMLTVREVFRGSGR